MSASGPLVADYPGRHPAPAAGSALTPFTPAAEARWRAPLPGVIYRDLWFAGGVWSRRATHATGVWGRGTSTQGREQSLLALLDDARTGGAVVLPDGSVLAGGPEAGHYAALAGQIIDRWESRGRPAMRDWRVGFALGGDPAAPIWIPARYRLDQAGLDEVGLDQTGLDQAGLDQTGLDRGGA
jgi:protein-L-isoaspartate(D-aspartate) O-methyltransferase